MEIHISLSAGGTQPSWGDGSSASRPLFLKAMPKDDKSQLKKLLAQSERAELNAGADSYFALKAYTGNHFVTINDMMRSGKYRGKYAKSAPQIMRLMKANAKMKAQKVWRGVMKPTLFHTLRTGARFVDKSFLSTTFSSEMAMNYSEGATSEHGEHNYLVHISVPENCPHYATNNLDEEELILPPGTLVIGKHYQYTAKAKGRTPKRVFHIVEAQYTPNRL